MIVLPIITRELGVAARKPATYWLRAASALAAILVVVAFEIWGTEIPFQSRGKLIFTGVSVLALVGCLLCGVFLTANSISIERREGTIGLLALTDLRPFGVILGKLVSTSMHAFFCLIAVFPVMALPLMMGGVTGDEFVRVLLVCVATTFFSLSAGIFASTISTEFRSGMAVGALLVVIPGALFFLWPSPFYAYLKAQALNYGSGIEFWRSLILICCAGALFIAAATRALPKFWRDQTASKPPEKLPEWVIAPETGNPELAKVNCSEAPALWLALRDPGPVHWLQPILVVGITLFGIFWFSSMIANSSVMGRGIAFALSIPIFVLHVLVKVFMAFEASRGLNLQRRSGALELLNTTPIQADEIILGYREALKRRFKGALICLTIVNPILALAIYSRTASDMPLDLATTALLGTCAVGILVLWLDVSSMSWIGMWRGLRSKTHAQAIAGSIAQLWLIPWVLALFGGVLLMFWSRRVFWAGALVWVIAAMFLSATAGQTARARLISQFRSLAAGDKD